MAQKLKTEYSKCWAGFCYWLLTKVMGWTIDTGCAPEKKVILLGVPHTSALDFIVSYLYYTSTRKVAHVMIKKEFFFWPVGPILRACGCIPVDRSSSTAMVRSVITAMGENEFFHLAIAPEGTRKPIKRWKQGYHLIAKATGATVRMAYFDWGTKHVGHGEIFELTDDAKADTARIQEIYETMHLKGRHPEKYITH